MICPYCNKEMKKGKLHGEGRGRMYYTEEGKKVKFIDRICGVNTVKAAVNGPWGHFEIETYFCEGCKKMIIDTDIER